MSRVFTTDRLVVRKLMQNDMQAFHKMQSDYEVMRFIRGKAMTYEENQRELSKLIAGYEKAVNDLEVLAVVRKSDSVFVGAVTLERDKHNSNEIGYRFIRDFWGNGYGGEILKGLIAHCRNIGLANLIAYVAVANPASEKILKKRNFEFQEDIVLPDLNIPERKYYLKL